ncbi:MAG: UDP-3-O-[3-hydroxymyristoyl] N-acetylglucosamine deacetylase [Candidatus Omnitrophica bacterium]|nr:UDP-3-O-[3-hydroxymyristoyl] N-acetylglucosamine deacetylase [Candidatus Omnitrophota bacterium]
MDERTISRSVEITGVALQTGALVSMTLKPAPPGTGIVFRRVDLSQPISFKLGEVLAGSSGARRTTVGIGEGAIDTIEHFMAALWALSVDNVIVEVGGPELPGLDGSALGFLKAVKEAGPVDQEKTKNILRVTGTVRVGNDDSYVMISPSDRFSVSYTIDYPVASIGKETFGIDLTGDNFEKEIAPARTFCLKREAEALLAAGYGKGADLGNTLVMGDDGPVGNTLRFPNEPLRHKILDLVGDLYILGIPIKGAVTACKSGHRLNAELVEKIYDKYLPR